MVRRGRDSPTEYHLTMVPCPIFLQGMLVYSMTYDFFAGGGGK